MSSEDQKNNDKESGFSGLSSMVTDVDATIAGTKHTPPPIPSSNPSNVQVPAENKSQEAKSSLYQQPPVKPSSYPTVVMLMIGIIGVVIFLVWVASLMDNRVTDVATSSPQPTENSASSSDSLQAEISSRPYEEMPPFGTNLVLTTNQIHYCLAENIRLEASKDIANNNIESDVIRFNAAVADYNNRCGQYRYRQSDLYNATSDIEPYRSLIESEGRSRFATIPATDTNYQQTITTPENTYWTPPETNVQDTSAQDAETQETEAKDTEAQDTETNSDNSNS